MIRFDTVAMNRLCQWIAGPGAVEINYHGMKPINIVAPASLGFGTSSDVSCGHV